MSTFHKEYTQFFTSPAGEHLLTSISSLRDSNHGKAENQPELARDYMQRAKGNSEVLDVVQSMTAGRNVTKQQIITP